MEKIKIQVTRGYLITILFIFGGVFNLFFGMKAYFDFKNAVLLSELKFDECVVGQYVYGNIDSYVVKKLETAGADNYSGECATVITATGVEYNFYTIPTVDNKYIRIMMRDKDNTDELKEFVCGRGEGVYIEGEIVETMEPLNYEWYKGVEGWKDKVLEEIVHPSYVIKEIDFSDKIKQVYIGIVFLLGAVGSFILSGGIENFVILEKNKAERQVVQHTKNYNKKNELEAEKIRLDSLKQRLNSLRRSCLYKIPVAICGIYIFTCSYFWEVRMVGIVIMVIGMKGIWKYFINSHLKAAQWIAGVFGLNTLWTQVEMCEYRIQVLNSVLSD